ncbi:MAG TPA: F0F1 ATP synthase subunit delta [Gammaproteobacteria bacterium]|nr:F0F1 ATP synthase subunit delta [Gammaproteobacteria bacterium]
MTIARPYARAAFECAQEEGNLDQWSSMLNVLKLVVSDEDMQAVIVSPRIENQQLIDFVTEICGDNLDEHGRNFVAILVNADRLLLMPQISGLFEALKAEAEGVAGVEVISAYPLDTDQEEKIRQIMAKSLGKKIVISTSIDESLIGGAIIRSGDSVIDASIKGRLRQLSHNFAE